MLSGRCCLNCSMNEIAKSKIFKEIFIQPASGDDGCSLGACYLAYKDLNKKGSGKILFLFGFDIQKMIIKTIKILK